MPNNLFRNEFKKLVTSALQAFKDASSINHAGLRGRIREILAEKLLEPILPPGVETGTGKITDSHGKLSAETDLIIYSRRTLPPLIYGHSTGLFPIEACIYAIEVKSKLNATELKDSIEKVKHLKTLQYIPGYYDALFKPVGPNVSPVIPVLFAFSTDLLEGGKSEIDRYREYDSKADFDPLIPVICIPGRGYWWFHRAAPDRKWNYHPPTADNDEVIDFIGGVANTIPDEIFKKGQPRFGNYLIESRKISKL